MVKIKLNYGTLDKDDNTIPNNNCLECLPFVPADPTQERWPKFCDYFDLGDKAPAFSLEGVYQGELVNINLSQYLGKWVALFFYRSDFTFV